MADLLPDRPRRVGAMDPVGRRAEIHGPDAERITRVAAWHISRKRGVFPPHFRGWRPHRVDPLADHLGCAGPARLADRSTDRVGDRPLLRQDVIEPALAELDADGSRLGVRRNATSCLPLVRGAGEPTPRKSNNPAAAGPGAPARMARREAAGTPGNGRPRRRMTKPPSNVPQFFSDLGNRSLNKATGLGRQVHRLDRDADSD